MTYLWRQGAGVLSAIEQQDHWEDDQRGAAILYKKMQCSCYLSLLKICVKQKRFLLLDLLSDTAINRGRNNSKVKVFLSILLLLTHMMTVLYLLCLTVILQDVLTRCSEFNASHSISHIELLSTPQTEKKDVHIQMTHVAWCNSRSSVSISKKTAMSVNWL